MIGRERGVLIRRLFRRFDHWLLLRAPILWRTRLLHCLLLLCLLILAKSPFVQTSISLPSGILPGNIILTTCWLQVSGVVVVLGLWVRSILRKPVGEIALRRHVVTVVAVGVGSYLWLVTPSLFAYVEINAIKGVDLSDRELQADVEFLGLYKGWDCIPQAYGKMSANSSANSNSCMRSLIGTSATSSISRQSQALATLAAISRGL
jgi:hypothetical protein